jgi:hypothetical protein
MAHRIFLGIVVALVVAAMVWDQIRLKNMPAWKWPLAALMLAIMEASVWLN